ncbi:hypothetical protein [Paenibacillus sp. FSL R7-0333]|uniref:hypothetical protein n=1 Tax=Paenibacillus sp. FSL R7-0333 TaxID=1926587 RepID=UPI0030FBAED6
MRSRKHTHPSLIRYPSAMGAASPLQTAEWYELENVQSFYQFFNQHKHLFE